MFIAEEDRPGQHRVAVLSHRFWTRTSRGDRNVIGRDIRLDGEPVTVIGVMPPAFEDPCSGGRWICGDRSRSPMASAPIRRSNYLRVIARLKPGLSRASRGRPEDSLGTISSPRIRRKRTAPVFISHCSLAGSQIDDGSHLLVRFRACRTRAAHRVRQPREPAIRAHRRAGRANTRSALRSAPRARG